MIHDQPPLSSFASDNTAERKLSDRTRVVAFAWASNAVSVDGSDSAEIAAALARRGYGVWAADHWYSLGLRPTLDYEGTAVRIGMAHYNSHAEVDGLLDSLSELSASA